MQSPRLLRPKSRRLFYTFFALGLSGLVVPVACKSEPEFAGNQGSECETSEDCETGEKCDLEVNRCTSATCNVSGDCEDGQFCTSTNLCRDECSTCGSACEETTDCPAGQFCEAAGTCQQECDPGDASAPECEGRACLDTGKCASNDDIDIGNGGMGGGDGDGDNPDCIDVNVDFEPQIPNVVLLIDQSASMKADNFGAAVDDAIAAGEYVPWDCGDTEDWRWNVVRNVLLHPDNGVVKPLEDDVRFGMALYSSKRGNLGGACPMLTEVELAFGNHQTMLDSFECDELVDDTPTRESLTATAEQLAALNVEGPMVIVLATDGEPDTCGCDEWNAGEGRPQTCCRNSSNDEDNDCYMAPNNDVDYVGDAFNPAGVYEVDKFEQVQVVLEAQRIYQDLGIAIEVINVSNPGNVTLAAHLDDVALAGGAVGGVAIDGFDPGALGDAFQSIIDGVRSCAIDLDGEIAPGKENTGTVTLDGVELILDDPDGWQVNSPTQIELVGDACETIKSGDHDLDITFPCGAFRPPVLK